MDFASEGQWQQMVVGGLLPPVLSPLLNPASLLCPMTGPSHPQPWHCFFPRWVPWGLSRAYPFQSLPLRGPYSLVCVQPHLNVLALHLKAGPSDLAGKGHMGSSALFPFPDIPLTSEL